MTRLPTSAAATSLISTPSQPQSRGDAANAAGHCYPKFTNLTQGLLRKATGF